MRSTSIVDNCRSILRERSCNYPIRSTTISQQACQPKPCYPIPTNPIHSLYGVDNLRVPTVCCEEPSYCNTLYGLSPTIASRNYSRYSNCFDRNLAPIRNRPTNCDPCLTTPSENCIQLITNSIICKVRCKIPRHEVALLCCCLPSLIRQMMCKSPWLTPNDIIQWLSADIIRESMGCFDRTHFKNENDLRQPRQDHLSRERMPSERNGREDKETGSLRSRADDNDSLSSHRSATDSPSEHSASSKRSFKSVLGIPNKNTKKKKGERKKSKSRTPSARSFTSQKSKNLRSDSHQSDISPSWSADDQSRKSDRNTPIHLEGDARSSASHDRDSHLSAGSNEEFDGKSLDPSGKPGSIHPTSRSHLEYPGKRPECHSRRRKMSSFLSQNARTFRR